MTEWLPATPLLLAALLAAVTGGRLRALVMLAGPLLGMLLLWQFSPGVSREWELMGLVLTPVRVDRLSLLFGYLFNLAAFIGVVYALHVRDRLQDVAALGYAGSAVGAVFAGDLLTLFVFWELLTLTSVFLILARRSERSLGAGLRYLLMQVGSGVLLLAGTLLLYADSGSLAFEAIGLERPGGWLIFLAFGIKAGFPLLHTWLTDAYPEATVTGTVFLTAFTTKVAIYALARGFAGTELLIYIGALMACFPIFYAVIENDLRRVLAYSLINQLGFMVVGIGIGTELALNGAVAHAFAHILYKGLLMMSMGAVLQVTGEIRASELGGLYKKMPRTTVLCLIGAASISAFPLLSGFVSKSMVVAAALHEGYQGVWLALLFAAAGVFHHAGIKVPFFAFFHHDSRFVARAEEPPANMQVAMALAALFCVGIGVFPEYLYQYLPYRLEYSAYDLTHVLAQTQLLAFSALAFTWLKLSGIYPDELKSVNLDADWFYRHWLLSGWVRLQRGWQWGVRGTLRVLGRGVALGRDRWLLLMGHPQIPPRPYALANMVFWVVLMLGLTLILYL